MTERLNQLLHAEADQLDIPPVAADGRAHPRPRHPPSTHLRDGRRVAAASPWSAPAGRPTGGRRGRRGPASRRRRRDGRRRFAFGARSTSAVGEPPRRWTTPCTRCTTPRPAYWSAGAERRRPTAPATRTVTTGRSDGTTRPRHRGHRGGGRATDPTQPLSRLAEPASGSSPSSGTSPPTSEVAQVPLTASSPAGWRHRRSRLAATTCMSARERAVSRRLAHRRHQRTEGPPGSPGMVPGGSAAAARIIDGPPAHACSSR